MFIEINKILFNWRLIMKLLYIAVQSVFLFISTLYSQSNIPLPMPETDGAVYAIAQYGDLVYIGGDFSLILDNNGPYTMNNIACYNIQTGEVVSGWNPDIKGEVFCIKVSADGSQIFVGGYFEEVNFNRGAPARNAMAVFNNTNGDVLSWNALLDHATGEIDCDVYDFYIDYDNSVIYIGGFFGFASGTERNNLCCVSLIDGSLINSWSPSTDGDVYRIEKYGTRIYICGFFDEVNSEEHYCLVALDASDGSLQNWFPEPWGPEVSDFEISGNSMFVVGMFYMIGTNELIRYHIAEINLLSGEALAWNPSASIDGSVFTISIYNSIAYVGGFFYDIGGEDRNCVAAIRLGNDRAIEWAPEIDYPYAILANSSGVHVGGDFLFPRFSYALFPWLPAIPTLPERGLIAFGAILAGISAWLIYKKSTI